MEDPGVSRANTLQNGLYESIAEGFWESDVTLDFLDSTAAH